MDYTREASYSSFLISEMLQQIDIETAIREAAILAEGGDINSKLDVLTESVFDKVKEVWDKFLAFIKRIWAKFTETMMSVFDVDKPYLEKYRDIILKKPMLSGTTVSMRNYQIDLIIKSALEPFDYNMMKDDLADRSKLTHRFIDAFKVEDSTEDLSGWCKGYFCGGQEDAQEIDGDKINLSTFYDYCYTWKDKMLPALNKDITAINNSTTKAMNLVKNAEKDKPKAEEPAKATEAPKANNQTQQQAPNQNSAAANQTAANSGVKDQNASGNLFGDVDISRYSHLYEAEVKTTTTTSGSAVTTKGTTVGGDQTAAAAVKSTAVDANKTTVDGGTDDIEALKKLIDNYSYVASKIAAAKLTVSEWAYKEYMQVIKAHVKQQLGNKEETPDQSVKQGQTYAGKSGETEDGKQPANIPKATT